MLSQNVRAGLRWWHYASAGFIALIVVFLAKGVGQNLQLRHQMAQPAEVGPIVTEAFSVRPEEVGEVRVVINPTEPANFGWVVEAAKAEVEQKAGGRKVGPVRGEVIFRLQPLERGE